jgi:hypothetical protein
MNDDYRRRPETVIVPPSPHTEPRGAPQHSPYDRATTSQGTDYVSGVHRARGVRASSMERRLADRFNSELRSSPMRPTAHQGPPPPPPMLKTAATMPIMPISMVHPQMTMGGHHSSPAHHSSPGMAPVRRRHTMEEELYNTHHSPRSAGPQPTRPGGGSRTRLHRRTDDFDDGDDDDEVVVPPHVPATPPSRRSKNNGHRRREGGSGGSRPRGKAPDAAALAGLTGPGRGMDRVFEWANYVEPGPPPPPEEEEKMSTASSA